MLGGTLILQPLAQTADSDAGGLPDRGINILKANLDDRPDLVHDGSHKFTAALDDHTEGEHGAATVIGIGR